jgi:ABC-type xylose transport system permease subunit
MFDHIEEQVLSLFAVWAASWLDVAQRRKEHFVAYSVWVTFLRSVEEQILSLFAVLAASRLDDRCCHYLRGVRPLG